MHINVWEMQVYIIPLSVGTHFLRVPILSVAESLNTHLSVCNCPFRSDLSSHSFASRIPWQEYSPQDPCPFFSSIMFHFSLLDTAQRCEQGERGGWQRNVWHMWLASDTGTLNNVRSYLLIDSGRPPEYLFLPVAASVPVQSTGKSCGWEGMGIFTGNTHQARILAEPEAWKWLWVQRYMDTNNFIKAYFYTDTTHKQKSNHSIHIWWALETAELIYYRSGLSKYFMRSKSLACQWKIIFPVKVFHTHLLWYGTDDKGCFLWHSSKDHCDVNK